MLLPSPSRSPVYNRDTLLAILSLTLCDGSFTLLLGCVGFEPRFNPYLRRHQTLLELSQLVGHLPLWHNIHLADDADLALSHLIQIQFDQR